MPSKYLIFRLQWSIYVSICFNFGYYITKGSSVEFVEVDEPQKQREDSQLHMDFSTAQEDWHPNTLFKSQLCISYINMSYVD